MAFNDALSDMLARIKNAHKARKSFTACYKSKLNTNVLTVLKEEGYIRDFKNIEIRKGISNIQIDLKYYNGTPVIKNIKRVQVRYLRICTSSSKPIDGALRSGTALIRADHVSEHFPNTRKKTSPETQVRGSKLPIMILKLTGIVVVEIIESNF